MTQPVKCPVCLEGSSALHGHIGGQDYFTCQACGSIHIDPEVVAEIDAGVSLIGQYTETYWQQEKKSALDRACGESLCRAGEAILYCRRPVRRFLDVGAGPGFLLRSLQTRIDPHCEVFHGVEKFPPPYADRRSNFHEGGIETLVGSFDAGVCIEVVEHLTPRMLEGIAAGLAGLSCPGSFWLFNTGMPDYVRNEDPDYLDPVRRGHIISYSIAAVTRIFSRYGFKVGPLPGKSYAFFAEFEPLDQPGFDERIYRPLAENVALLQRDHLLYHAAFETARSSLYYASYLEHIRWVLSVQQAQQARESFF